MGMRIWLCGFILCVGASIAYRLPGTIVPEEYRLDVITNLGDENNKFDFCGKVWIKAIATENANNITLHSKNLKIEKDEAYVKCKQTNTLKKINITSVDVDEENEFLIINLGRQLEKGSHCEIYIPFNGEIGEGLAGYYRSKYIDPETDQKKWLAVTQFEPTDARRAFPCFDEPALKAKFTISIGRHKKYSSLSNMPLIRTVPMENKTEWEWDRYETSVPMSTYLVAYMVSDFKYRESAKHKNNNVTFKSWARENALDQVEFAKDIGPKLLDFFETYFNIKYPLPKQDLVAVPDFSAGAMENWGLITYRETQLLFDPNVSTAVNKLGIANVIAHELAHQWFGNFVTMKWWTDLWLNEGFATYMAAIAVDDLFPEWNSLEEDTVDNLLAVFSFDSLTTSHPVSVPIGNPKEIAEIFDTISYKKGSYLLHMMANFLGKETLQKGVSEYLKKHAYSNAEQDDLWSFITTEAHSDGALSPNLTTKTIMDTWTLQTGYPLITVKRKYGQNALEVKQERLLRDRGTTQTGKTKWWVPLSFTTESELDFNTTKPKFWLPPSSDTEKLEGFPADSDWVIFNIQASGLYRVNYDEKNWNLLIDTLKGDDFQKIPTLNRVLLIDDAANLAWVGRLDYRIFFNIVTYLEKEQEYLPWKSALKNIGIIDTLLKRTSTYGQFKDYMRKILKTIYNKIGGFRQTKGRDNRLDSIQHQVLTTTIACKYNVEHCIAESIKLFKNMQANPHEKDRVPKDLRGVVYCNGIKFGTEKEWNFLWNQYKISNVGAEKHSILKSLGCAEQSWLLQRYLEWAIDESSEIRRQDVVTVFYSVMSNDLGFYIVRNFIRDNIKTLYDCVQPTVSKLSTIISNLAGFMTSFNDYEWLQNFTRTNDQYFREIRQGADQALETAKLNAQWHKENLKDIQQLLRQFKD